jgi:hypothetical protein
MYNRYLARLELLDRRRLRDNQIKRAILAAQVRQLATYNMFDKFHRQYRTCHTNNAARLPTTEQQRLAYVDAHTLCVALSVSA